MKKIIFISLLFIVVCGYRAVAQCDPVQMGNACISKVSAAGFNFLKTYNISGKPDLTKIEYSYVFTKGTQYMVSICDQNSGENTIMVTIYDAQRKKVANNKVNGRLLTGMVFPSNATGIYYLQFTFEGSSPRCGGSALGFKK